MLILQASPRKNGNVWQMAEKIEEEYKSRNFQVETIDVTKMAFHDCIGCMKCQKNCPAEAIKVVDNLAVVDYDKCIGCGTCVKGCPVGCLELIKI